MSYWRQLEIAEQVADTLRRMRLEQPRASLGSAIRLVSERLGVRRDQVELAVKVGSW